jgi:hypothetical protein
MFLPGNNNDIQERRLTGVGSFAPWGMRLEEY